MCSLMTVSSCCCIKTYSWSTQSWELLWTLLFCTVIVVTMSRHWHNCEEGEKGGEASLFWLAAVWKSYGNTAYDVILFLFVSSCINPLNANYTNRWMQHCFCLFQVIRVQSPDGMKKIPSTKRETAAAFLKKVPRVKVLILSIDILSCSEIAMLL